MRTLRRTVSVSAVTLALAVGLTACGEDDTVDKADQERASRAALAAVGEGSVTSVDRGDEEDTYEYEVEVQRPGGGDVDVQLDQDFDVTNEAALRPASSSSSSASPSSAGVAEDEDANDLADTDTDRDGDDRPLTGSTLKRASAAALQETKGGTVTETGRSDDADHAYDVEVRLPNGRDVDVDLDRSFKVVRVDR